MRIVVPSHRLVTVAFVVLTWLLAVQGIALAQAATPIEGTADAVHRVPLPKPRPISAALSEQEVARAILRGHGAEPSATRRATLEAMIGQMLMVGFEGTTPEDREPRALRQAIGEGRLGGVILFARNVESERAVRRLTGSLRAASDGPPVLIALDQEGGRVQRLTPRVGFSHTPSHRSLATGGEADAARAYGTLAKDLARWGFNYNLAPVVDLAVEPRNPIIARLGRAFSADPATVTQFAGRFVDAHRSAGVLTALKHFPGHGSSLGDTHRGFVDVSATWRRDELEPFARLIDGGLADSVMVAHVHLRDRNAGLRDGASRAGLEAPATRTKRPATLSPAIIEGLLRTELGFDGVVISDDLRMDAVRSIAEPAELAVMAVRAGNDVLVFGGTGPGTSSISLIDELQERFAEEAARDPAFRARIEASYGRILAMKSRLRLGR